MKARAERIIRSVIDLLERGERFLVLNHLRPDGDGTGSQLALARVLRQRGKQVWLYSQEPIPDEYLFLPGARAIRSTWPRWKGGFILVVLDAPQPDRASDVLPVEQLSPEAILNIDHHVSNVRFGTVNWVDPEASSVGEMLGHLFSAWGVAFDGPVAACLYTSIFTDTGGFSYPSTTASSLAMACRLVTAGADPSQIARAVYEHYRPARFRLLAETLRTIRLHLGGRVATMRLRRAMLARARASAADTDGFVNFPRSIRGVQTALFFQELPGRQAVKVGLRSTGDGIDVNAVAQRFGGGGHRTAAGFTTGGTLAQVERAVVRVVAVMHAGRDHGSRKREVA